MDSRIRDLLGRIGALEDELRSAMHEREARVFYKLNNGRIEFERETRAMHLRVKRGLLRWLVTDRPQNLITGPIIYGLALPLLLLDLVVTLYQATCFPIYRIARVRRGDFIVFDRHRLGYLNLIERFHCEYCAYATGLLAYVTEIAARTEQYFCPIKHARKVLGTHARYARFIEFGQADLFHARQEMFRQALAQDATPAAGAADDGKGDPPRAP